MRKTTSIALKLFAIYLIFNVLVAMPTLVAVSWRIANMHGGQMSPVFYPLIILIPSLMLATLAIWIIWKTANSIDQKENFGSGGREEIDLDKLYQYAISLMGVFFTVTALLALPSQFLNLQMSNDPIIISKDSVSFGTVVIQLLLGCLLIARPRQWVAWLKCIGETKVLQED